MKTDKMMDLISEMDPKYIEEAAFELDETALQTVIRRRREKRRHFYGGLVSVAACAVILLAVWSFGGKQFLRKGDTSPSFQNAMEENYMMDSENDMEMAAEEPCVDDSNMDSVEGITGFDSLQNCSPKQQEMSENKQDDSVIWNLAETFISFVPEEESQEEMDVDGQRIMVSITTSSKKIEVSDDEESSLDGKEVFFGVNEEETIRYAYFVSGKKAYLLTVYGEEEDTMIQCVSLYLEKME